MTKNRILTLALLLLPLATGAQVRYISLKECLELSHTNNPDVVNASLDVRAARAQKQEASANWFPTVSAKAFGFNALDPLVKLGLGDLLGSNDAANSLRYYAETAAGLSGLNTEWSLLGRGYVAGLSVSQPIFAGGRIANGNALASLGIRAADVKKGIALRDNDDAVKGKYWTIISLEEKKTALQQGIDLVASLENDVKAAVEAGLAKDSDLMQVRLKAKELEASMIKLRSGVKLAKMDLFNTVGIEYNVLKLDDMVLNDGFDGLLAPQAYWQDEEEKAAALEESKLLGMSVEAKRLEKKMSIGEALPTIGVGASLGYGQIVGDPRANGLIYAMISIPITDWAKTARKVQRAQYELDKTENEKAFLDKQLVVKVNKEWIELQSAWEEMETAGEAVALSELLEAQKRSEYEAGLCTLSELLQAQTDLQSARSALVDSKAAYCTALAVWNNDSEK